MKDSLHLDRKILFLFTFFILTSIHSLSEASAPSHRISLSKSLAHYAMGQVYDLLGLTNKAILEYQSASQFDERNGAIHLRLGADYARIGMLPQALEHLHLVNQYNPEELQSRYLLALVHSTMQDYDKAANEYEYILKSFSKTEPQNIEIYGYLGQLYYSQKKYDQAIEEFQKILELEPANADVLYLLGSLYVETNQKERAIDLLKKSISANPQHDGSLNSLSYLYAEDNAHLDEALDLIERALKVDPNNGAYQDTKGWIYYKKEEYKKALDSLKAADLALSDPVIKDHLGDVYAKLNLTEEAVKYWEASIELRPHQEDIMRKINEAKGIKAR